MPRYYKKRVYRRGYGAAKRRRTTTRKSYGRKAYRRSSSVKRTRFRKRFYRITSKTPKGVNPLYYHIIKNVIGPNVNGLQTPFDLAELNAGSDQFWCVPSQFSPFSWNDMVKVYQNILLANRTEFNGGPAGASALKPVDDAEVDFTAYIRKIWGQLKVKNQSTNPVKVVIWELKCKNEYTYKDFADDGDIVDELMRSTKLDSETMSFSSKYATAFTYGYSPYMCAALTQYFKIKKWASMKLGPNQVWERRYKRKPFKIGSAQFEKWYAAGNPSNFVYPKGHRFWLFQTIGDPMLAQVGENDIGVMGGLHKVSYHHDMWVKFDWGKPSFTSQLIYDDARGNFTYANPRGLFDDDWTSKNVTNVDP